MTPCHLLKAKGKITDDGGREIKDLQKTCLWGTTRVISSTFTRMCSRHQERPQLRIFERYMQLWARRRPMESNTAFSALPPNEAAKACEREQKPHRKEHAE